MKGFLKCASVTKKITLAIVGGFLMVFLLVHAGINLCMLRNDGGEWFRAAAHFMGTNYIVKVFEVILFAALIVHVVLAVILQIGNWMARPVGYKVRGKAQTAPGSRFMIYTGILVAIFLVIHLMNFYFVKLGWVQGALLPDGEPDFYTIAQGLFNNPAYLVLYLVLILGLGIHLMHAFPSALHTLGLNGEKADRIIKLIGALYAIVVVLMFYATAIGMAILF
ncbi:MAG: succinate dehydrogenase cytochrome b subunit [Bacteroidales bacterium]|nr:succinate dehydrogenase cytochrome b subunit [Bacteroidales bacterium]